MAERSFAANGTREHFPLTAERAAELAGCSRYNSVSGRIGGVAVDSRKLRRGDLFVALKGERTDGHLFLSDAVESGASALLVSQSFLFGDEGRSVAAGYNLPILYAADTLAALQRLGRGWLEGFPELRRVAVTGSNGKTTTKELIASVLAQVGETIRNSGNLNSEIGLPQAVMEVREKHRYGVFEMGINHPNEMDLLTEVYRPEFTVITTIGTAHIGLLGSREAIAREKGKAIAALPDKGRGFIPEDTEWYDYLSSISRAPLIPYGEKSTKGVEKIEDLGFEGWLIRYEGRDIRLALMGRHNLSNAMAAITVGRYFGASSEQIAGGLESVSALEGRSRYHRGGITVFEDSYNANLDSMRAVIEEMAGHVQREELVLVLGAMKELGEEVEWAHRELGRIITRTGAAAVFLLGDEMRWTVDELGKKGFTGVLFRSNDFDELKREVLTSVRSGQTILLKGSRVMELERLVEPLQNLGAGVSETPAPVDRSIG